jgi:hypothetical protein
LFTWRITKYNPENRDDRGKYQNDEWTSCHDIGKVYNGKEFTANDYINVENTYILAVLSFVNSANISTLKVKNLEKYNDSIKINEGSIEYTDEMIKLFERLEDDAVLEIEQIEQLCRLILREQVWCKLEDTNKLLIYFGYDYYMYISCLSKPDSIISLLEERGLYIEELDSIFLP